jgi:hypothetical protein
MHRYAQCFPRGVRFFQTDFNIMLTPLFPLYQTAFRLECLR